MLAEAAISEVALGAPPSVVRVNCARREGSKARLKPLDVCINIQHYMEHEPVFKALADPSRRRILTILQKGSMTAGGIAEHFDFAAPSVSHHLAALKSADLVRSERRGQTIVYSLNTSVLQDVSRFILNLLDTKGRGRK